MEEKTIGEDNTREEYFKYNKTSTGKINWELKLSSKHIDEDFWKRVDDNLLEAKKRVSDVIVADLKNKGLEE